MDGAMRIDQATYPIAARTLAARRIPHWQLVLLLCFALLPLLLLVLPLPALVRVPLGIAVVLFGPGYALVAVLFQSRELDLPARLGISIGLSVALLPLLALVLDQLPWGLRPWPMAASLSAWAGLCTMVAVLRRLLRAPDAAGDEEEAPSQAVRAWWGSLGTRGQLSYVIGAALFAAVLLVGARAMTAPDPTRQLTEFYALGAEGLAESYPREVAPGEPMQVQVGITNREGIAASYRVEASTGGVLLAQLGPVELADGETWQAPLRYSLAQPDDDQQIEIVLFRDDQPAPYRTLRLWVNVQEATP
jgi:uncharacterized membrane protein